MQNTHTEREREKGETNRKEAQKVRSTREENVAIFCREHAVCVYMCVCQQSCKQTQFNSEAEKTEESMMREHIQVE